MNNFTEKLKQETKLISTLIDDIHRYIEKENKERQLRKVWSQIFSHINLFFMFLFQIINIIVTIVLLMVVRRSTTGTN